MVGGAMGTLTVTDPGELQQHLKQEVGTTGYVELGQERIDAFADLSEDWQWIHTDVERARTESPFGATVAHGFLTLAFLSRFHNEVVRVERMKLLVSCGLTSVRFLSPVPAGSRIRSRVRLKTCDDHEDFVEATWRFTIEVEDVRHPCCIADWVVRYQR